MCVREVCIAVQSVDHLYLNPDFVISSCVTLTKLTPLYLSFFIYNLKHTCIVNHHRAAVRTMSSYT